MDADKQAPKFLWKGKRPRIAKPILRNNKSEGLTLSDFKAHSKVTVNNTGWCWQQDKQISQAGEGPDTDPRNTQSAIL